VGGINWVGSGWGHQPSTVDDVLFAINRIGTWASSRRYAFRGVKNHGWPIQSSLQRFIEKHHGVDHVHNERSNRAAERRVLELARRWELEDGGQATDQTLLARLQHHGSPTRLLDVTSDPITALWFATEPFEQRGVHGVVFAFDITGLSVLEANPPDTWGSVEDPHGWHFEHQLELSLEQQQPFVVRPFPRDQRMAAQQAFFLTGVVPEAPTIHGLDVFPLSADPPGEDRLKRVFGQRSRGYPAKIPFVAIVVPHMLKAKIRAALESTWSRRRETLFPDLAGLAAAIQDEPQRIDVSIAVSSSPGV